jgi:hypothetical protein
MKTNIKQVLANKMSNKAMAPAKRMGGQISALKSTMQSSGNKTASAQKVMQATGRATAKAQKVQQAFNQARSTRMMSPKAQVEEARNQNTNSFLSRGRVGF